MRRATPAEKFYTYLEDWVLRQRAQHGEAVAKERLRAKRGRFNGMPTWSSDFIVTSRDVRCSHWELDR
jgi:hypothetical protein